MTLILRSIPTEPQSASYSIMFGRPVPVSIIKRKRALPLGIFK